MRQMRAATLTGYLEVARHVGLDPFEMLRQFEIRPDFLDKAENRHAARPIVELLEESATRSGCTCFGLLLADCRSFSELGPLCLLLERLPTVRHVAKALSDYRRHFNDIVDIVLDEGDETSLIVVELLPDFVSAQIIDLTVARLFRNLTGASGGRWIPASVHLTHEAPSDTSIFKRYFPCRIEWRSSFNGLSCPTDSLGIPNPLADEIRARHASQLLNLVELGPEDAPVADQARRAISLLLPDGRATVEQVAMNLGLSPSAFRRRLERENRVFASLLNEVRRDLALRYLSNSTHTITTISDLIGYTSISSFTRWFTGEFGMSPVTWRSAQLNVAAVNGRRLALH